MGMENMAVTGGGINWALIGTVGGCFIVGIIIGIVLGRRVMKKRDI